MNTDLPSPETLAMIAATVGKRRNARSAVEYAFDLWSLSRDKLIDVVKGKAVAVAIDILKNGASTEDDIPRPTQFPASLSEFKKLIVKGKNDADSRERFKPRSPRKRQT
ncbi:MAG: hypothetical protein FJ403_01160 [Verrucomicrobia bacterium]|nr:hypothetical protein [Verrucomicrobiota bacterium]